MRDKLYEILYDITDYLFFNNLETDNEINICVDIINALNSNTLLNQELTYNYYKYIQLYIEEYAKELIDKIYRAYILKAFERNAEIILPCSFKFIDDNDVMKHDTIGYIYVLDDDSLLDSHMIVFKIKKLSDDEYEVLLFNSGYASNFHFDNNLLYVPRAVFNKNDFINHFMYHYFMLNNVYYFL